MSVNQSIYRKLALSQSIGQCQWVGILSKSVSQLVTKSIHQSASELVSQSVCQYISHLAGQQVIIKLVKQAVKTVIY